MRRAGSRGSGKCPILLRGVVIFSCKIFNINARVLGKSGLGRHV